jgi:hypothetical protein
MRECVAVTVPSSQAGTETESVWLRVTGSLFNDRMVPARWLATAGYISRSNEGSVKKPALGSKTHVAYLTKILTLHYK